MSVLIASPGDTSEARDAVESPIGSWNRDRAKTRRVVLLPFRWETDAVPAMGSDPQSIINRQLVDSSDIVVALFLDGGNVELASESLEQVALNVRWLR